MNGMCNGNLMFHIAWCSETYVTQQKRFLNLNHSVKVELAFFTNGMFATSIVILCYATMQPSVVSKPVVG